LREPVTMTRSFGIDSVRGLMARGRKDKKSKHEQRAGRGYTKKNYKEHGREAIKAARKGD